METILKLIKRIRETEYLDNKRSGSGFANKNSELYVDILKYSSEIEQTKLVNTTLRSRVIFIVKYKSDLNKIKVQNGWLTFNPNIDDFIDKTGNGTLRGWENSKNKILNSENYSKEKTIEILSHNNYYKLFFGKSRNRTLIKQDLCLYNSIIKHTKCLDVFNKNTNKFTGKLVFLVEKNGEMENLICPSCEKNYTLYNPKLYSFNTYCKKCFGSSDLKYPKLGYFKLKYGDEWKKYYEDDRTKIKNYKVNSKVWFIRKYGEENGLEKYSKYSRERVAVIENLKYMRFSKISQLLFWSIYNELTDNEKLKCYFKELNKEKSIIDINGKVYYPDFLMENKIIEYDGKYWHNEDKDKMRNIQYIKAKYTLLVLNENDYRRGYMPNATIKKCLLFLRDERKP